MITKDDSEMYRHLNRFSQSSTMYEMCEEQCREDACCKGVRVRDVIRSIEHFDKEKQHSNSNHDSVAFI